MRWQSAPKFNCAVGLRQTLIIMIVRRRQRGLPAGRGVLPIQVQAWLDDYRCEQALRKEMAALWRAGLLERIGGEGCRRGYRVVS